MYSKKNIEDKIEEAKKFVKKSEFDKLSEKKKKGGSYFTAARDAANCVYPEIKNKTILLRVDLEKPF